MGQEAIDPERILGPGVVATSTNDKTPATGEVAGVRGSNKEDPGAARRRRRAPTFLDVRGGRQMMGRLAVETGPDGEQAECRARAHESPDDGGGHGEHHA